MKNEFTSQKARGRICGAIRRSFASFLLLVLLTQISPFTLREPPSVVDREQGIASYLKPLQVCDDGAVFGGILADHSWLPTLSVVSGSYPQGIVYLTVPTARLPQGHSQRLLRPPQA